MASGFGTFNGSYKTFSGATGALVSAVVSQAVNSSARTVTVTITASVGYARVSGGLWNIPSGQNLWRTNHTDAYLKVTLDGTTASVPKPSGSTQVWLGVAANGAQSVNNGSILTVPSGKVKAATGGSYAYSTSVTVSKTFNYDNSGTAITKYWSAEAHIYHSTAGWCTVNIGVDSQDLRSFTTDAIAANIQAPSSLSVSNITTTTNSVSGTYKVGNWGNETDTSKKKMWARVLDANSDARREVGYVNVSSANATISNSSTAAGGGITIKGAGQYRTDVYASNSAGGTTSARTTVYTVPNAPTISYTTTEQSTNVKVNVTVAGSSSNTANNVTTYWKYRKKPSGGAWSSWTEASYTGAANGTNSNLSFTCDYGSQIELSAYQAYQGKNSSAGTASGTVTSGTAPSGGTVTVTGSTWNSVTLQASGINYGKPDGISSRGSIVGVTPEASSYSYKREVGLGAVTSGTGTVNNSSASGGSAQPFDLKGMMPVYAYLWVNNTVQSAFVEHKSTPYYLPPAPGSLTYTTVASGSDIDCTLNYVGVAANNYTSYTAADLTRTVRYKGDQDANWTYVENGTQVALTTATTETITIEAAHNAVIEAWMTYDGKDSEHSSITVVNSNDPVHLYASVNGETTKVIKLYGSVNNETVKIKKLYASVNGVARKVFEDAS